MTLVENSLRILFYHVKCHQKITSSLGFEDSFTPHPNYRYLWAVKRVFFRLYWDFHSPATAVSPGRGCESGRWRSWRAGRAWRPPATGTGRGGAATSSRAPADCVPRVPTPSRTCDAANWTAGCRWGNPAGLRTRNCVCSGLWRVVVGFLCLLSQLWHAGNLGNVKNLFVLT